MLSLDLFKGHQGVRNVYVACILYVFMCFSPVLIGSDSDVDWMDDTWEVQNGLNPNDPSDAMTDLDQDSFSNLGEYLHSSDPNDSAVVPTVNISIAVPADVPGIQEAINASIDGDVVVVSPGTYNESIHFKGHEIHLRSTDPNDAAIVASTVINADSGHPAILFNSRESANTRVQGLTLTHGTSGLTCYGTASPKISKCSIVANSSYGVYIQGGSDAAVCLDQCRILGNGGNGGAAIVCRYSKLILTHSIVAKNGASWSTAVYLEYGDAGLSQIINCTVTGHTYRGIYNVSLGDNTPDIRHCILWDNGDDLKACSATYSCIQNGDAGLGNISVDPRFVNMDAADYHLAADSLCIDAGAPWGDYGHEPSPNGNRVNMGGYGGTSHAITSSDSDGDGISDNWEAFYWPDDDPSEHHPEDDPDQDSFSNQIEYLYGYNPTMGTNEEFSILHVGIYPETFNPTNDETVSIRYWSNRNATGDMKLVSSAGTDTVINPVSLSAVAGMNQTQWDGLTHSELIAKRGIYGIALTLDDGRGNMAANAPVSVNLTYDHKIDAIYCNPQRISPLDNEVMRLTYRTAIDADVLVNVFDSQGALFRSYPIVGSASNELVLNGASLPVGDSGSQYLSNQEDYSIEITYQGMEETKQVVDTRDKRDESRNHEFDTIGLSGYMYSDDEIFGYHYYASYDRASGAIKTIGYYGTRPIDNPDRRFTTPGPSGEALSEKIRAFHDDDPGSIDLAAKEAWLDALESGWLARLYHELGWTDGYVPTEEQCHALADIMLKELLPNWEYEEGAGWVNTDAVSTGGDPVLLSNGEFILSVTDLAISGRVLPVQIVRTYGSRRQYNGRFGYGWDMNYNMKMRRLTDPNVVVFLDGQGNKREYRRLDTDPNVLMRDSDLSTRLHDNNKVLTLKTKTGIEYLFDPNGNLSKIFDENGNALTFTYDCRGRLPIKGFSGAFHKEELDGPENRYGVVALEYQLNTITDDLGRDTTLIYDANGLLRTITDFANRTSTYTYDPNTNNLLTVTDPNGHTTTYAYGLRHNITEITDPNGQVYTANTYDFDKRVVSQAYGEGLFTFDYDYDANEVIVIDREGGIRKTMLNEHGQILTETMYTADPLADPNEFTVTNTFNTHSNIKRTTLPAGNCVDYAYDERGNITAIYQKATVSDPNTATDPNVLATCFTYDPNHVYKPKTLTDPEGRVTTFEYDQNGNMIRMVYPTVGQQTPIVQNSYNTYGQLDTSTSPDGIVSKYLYCSEPSDANNYGHLWKAVADYGTDPNCQNITVEFAYDLVGNLVQTTDPNGNTSQFVYNEINQLVKTINSDDHETFFGYNNNKKLAWTRTQVNNVDQTIRYTYDLLDHIKTITDPLGHIATHQYNKNEDPNCLTDPEGNTAERVYNDRGLVWQVIDANGGVTEYTYDKNGNVTQIKDAQGNITQYCYDKFDTLIRTTYEGDTYEELYYNRNNQVTRRVNRAGQGIDYRYDALGRLTVKDRVNDPNISFAYDIAGRLTDVNDGAGIIQYTYDSLGRIEQIITDAENQTVSYEYDTRGLRTKMTYPGFSVLSEKPSKPGQTQKPEKGKGSNQGKKHEKGKNLPKEKGPKKDPRPKKEKKHKKQNAHQGAQQTEAFSLAYSYDTMGRIQQITTDTNDVLAEYAYDDLSRRTELTLGNGASVVYEYDLGNRLTKLTNHISSTEAISFEYADYDKVGNRLSARTNADPSEVYTYDNRYQLTSVDYNDGTFSVYGYDKLGNRTTENDGSITHYFSNSLNQYTAVSSTGLNYDANGNLTGLDGHTYYDYDCENRLTHVVDQNGDSVATYAYDYLGRRIQKIVYGNANAVTKYAYDGDQVIAEYDGSDNLLRRFVYGPGIDEPICMIDVKDDNRVYYYHFNGLGSVVALSDMNNTIVERYAYSIFGEPSRISDVNNPYLFTGRRLDTETKLYHYRARYYTYDIGRFLQTDPIGYADGINWYRYCGNNPVGLVDPFGLYAGIDDAIASGVGLILGVATQGVSDLVSWERSSWREYGIAAVSGAAAGEAFIYAGPLGSGAAGAFVKSSLTQASRWGNYDTDTLVDPSQLVVDTAIGGISGVLAGAVPIPKIPGINHGRNSLFAISRSTITKLRNGTIRNVSSKTMGKMVLADLIDDIPSSILLGIFEGLTPGKK